MQVGSAVQFHVAPPLIDTKVRPVGTASVTVTVPLVGPAPAVLLTVTVYVAPLCPCVKFPVCALPMLNTGGLAMIVVESVVFAPTDPPPLTPTLFTCGVEAFDATFTVTVIAG